jgi:hypothetical protein
LAPRNGLNGLDTTLAALKTFANPLVLINEQEATGTLNGMGAMSMVAVGIIKITLPKERHTACGDT